MAKKRIGTLLFVVFFSLIHVVPSAMAAEGEEGAPPIFSDIDTHWVKNAAEALYNMGALSFQEGESFSPNKPITRAELLYVILTVKGLTPTDQRQLPYTDLPKDAWYTPYVETAYRIGLIDGKGEKFYPTASLSRQNMIDIVLRSLGEGVAAQKYQKLASLSKYADRNAVDKPFRPIVAYATDKGYIGGDSSKKINPLKEATRAEAVQLIYNTLYQQLSLPDLKKEEVAGVPVLFFQKVTILQATAYSGQEKGIGLHTALGWDVREGIVSVDPSIIPYGTHLYIPGYGYAVAADRGGEIKELKIDLYIHSLAVARRFGLKKNLPVYILDPVKISIPSK